MDDKENIHSGHRESRKKTFLTWRSFQGWSDHEVLEYLLFGVLPRVNTNEIAHRLINTCGGFDKVFTAPRSQLKLVSGVGDKVCDYIYMLGGFVDYYNDYERREIPMMIPGHSLKYLRKLFQGKEREHFYVICLDKKGRVIGEKLMSDGNFEMTDVNIANVVRAAVASDAAEIILAHNHPNGILEPSNPDIVVTELVEEALKPLGIALKDHIIVTNEGCICIKDLKKKNNEKIIYKFKRDNT